MLDDPYPLYHRLQAEAPVLIHRSMAIVTRHRDVEPFVRDMDAYSNRRDQGSTVEQALAAMSPALARKARESLRYFGLWLTNMDRPSIRESAPSRISLSHRTMWPGCESSW
jgi:hypothetical protein